MHELSIVAAVLEQLSELQKQQGGARITKVGLRIGEVAGVDVDCLRFGFECTVKETEWEPLVLEIEQVTRRQLCPSCNLEFEARDFGATLLFSNYGQMVVPPHLPTDGRYGPPTACPQCGETFTRTVAGEELQIAFVEVETSEVEGR